MHHQLRYFDTLLFCERDHVAVFSTPSYAILWCPFSHNLSCKIHYLTSYGASHFSSSSFHRRPYTVEFVAIPHPRSTPSSPIASLFPWFSIPSRTLTIYSIQLRRK